MPIQPMPAAADGAPPLNRLLLIEDNEADARLIREMLRESAACSCEISAARTLAEAAERLAADDVDVVLLDLSLPDAQGLDALSRVLALAPRMPVVVLTGLEDEDIALRAARQGAQDYLLKREIQPALLVRAIRYARERKRLQEAEQVLAEAGSLLAASLDYEETLQSVGRLAVRFLADYCVIDIADEGGVLRRLHVSHADPQSAGLAARLLSLPLDAGRPHLSFEAVRTRTSVLAPSVPDELLRSIAQDDEHLALLRALRPRSYMAVPMLAHERLVGALLFVSSRHIYDADDVALAEKLAHLAALEVDNARLYQAAQEAIRSRDRILGIVAHDLRNPLNTIAMGIDLMMELELAPEVRTRQLHTIRRTADRMNRLIQDLLDVGRIHADRLVLHVEPLDPVRLAREAVEFSGVLASAKEQALTCEPASEPVGHVEADHDRVLRVLTNLIDNAIKFTPRGGAIRVRVLQDGDEVRFCVDDTGPGIPPEEQPQLFQPFWQSRRGSGEGAGLGLAIARGLVEAHGGRIWAESEPERGATLCFTLPAARERREG